MVKCPFCLSSLRSNSQECPNCGYKFSYEDQPATNNNPSYQSQPSYQPPNTNGGYTPPQHPNSGYQPQTNYGQQPVYKSDNRILCGCLAIFLGSFGIHKFLMGKIGMGILYIFLSFLGISGIIGFVEGIIYLCMTNEDFYRKYPSLASYK